MSVMARQQLPLNLKPRSEQGFDAFVVGDNRVPVSRLQALAAGESGQIYLAGATGFGKSHLLNAAVSRALENGIQACLLPGRELTGLPPSVLEGMEQFTLLALDDLDSLTGHAEWEEALFHLYNRMRQAGGTLLLAASGAPRNLGLGLPDLMTRLAAGEVYRLKPLGESGLTALLRQRAGERGLRMPDDVARYILLRHGRSAPALVECLERLDQAAWVAKRPLTVPFVREVMGW
jgi:DnaA family protein